MRYPEKKLNKAERSWAMYDWANSVYSAIIMTSIFPIYFTSAVDANGGAGSVVWGFGTSIATLLVVVLAPICGSFADFRNMKKRLLSISLIIGVLSTLSMAVFDNWKLMLIGYIISYLGYALGNVFYDSFLTDVTTRERMDMVSARGYAYGYIGGSTIPFLIAVLVMMFAGNIHLSQQDAVKICIIITAIWWVVFSFPIMENVEQKHWIERPKHGIIRAGLCNLAHTAKEIISIKPLLMFMISYFFYIDGVNTVIHMATSYGTTLGLSTASMIGALMVTVIVAVPCSVAFAALAQRFGTRRVLLGGAGIYFIVCLIGFVMGFTLENATALAESAREIGGNDAYNAIYQPALKRSQIMFWVLALLVGTSQGGMQALSRSQFSRMIPPERSNEFFGFYEIFGKFAAVLGPMIYAFFTSLTGRSSFGILSLLGLFSMGVILLLLTPSSAFSEDHHTLFSKPKTNSQPSD